MTVVVEWYWLLLSLRVSIWSSDAVTLILIGMFSLFNSVSGRVEVTGSLSSVILSCGESRPGCSYIPSPSSLFPLSL